MKDAPKDGTHGTFFRVLPTPRPYARFPFYNMMNNEDFYETSLFRLPRALANAWDVSLDAPLAYGFSITASQAHAWGKDLFQSIYPAGSNTELGYLETNFHF